MKWNYIHWFDLEVETSVKKRHIRPVSNSTRRLLVCLLTVICISPSDSKRRMFHVGRLCTLPQPPLQHYCVVYATKPPRLHKTLTTYEWLTNPSSQVRKCSSHLRAANWECWENHKKKKKTRTDTQVSRAHLVAGFTDTCVSSVIVLAMGVWTTLVVSSRALVDI